MALAELADVLARVITVQAPPPGKFPFPDDAAVLTELTNAPDNWPVIIKRHLDDFVLPRFNKIPATTVAGVGGAPKMAWNTPAQLAKIMRNQATVAFARPLANNALPKSTPARFDFKLHQLQEAPGHDIVNGYKLVADYTGVNPNEVPSSAFATRSAALQSIKNLAVFEGFCVRVAVAITAADLAKVSLAETLALWRTEGDLLCPYSEKRWEKRAPTYDFIAQIALGKRTPEVFFSMIRGLWSSRLSALARENNKVFTNKELPEKGTKEEKVFQEVFRDAMKLLAFKDWSVIIAGLDFFWQKIKVFDLQNRVASEIGIASFLNENHIGRWGAGAEAFKKLIAACREVLDDLVVQAKFNDVDERITVAPENPAGLVSLWLSEALIFADLDTTAGKGPVLPPTPKLKYLAYHCQDHRDPADPANDKFTLMLVSAAVSAAKGPAGPLRTSLQIPNLPKPTDLKKLDFNPDLKIPGIGDTRGHVAAFQRLMDAGWWSVPLNLELLADFMIVATSAEAGMSAQWRGWEELRGNMARYRKLLDYYEGLLT